MNGPREVLYQSLRPFGFRHYVDIHAPRNAAAATLIRKIKADPRFPRELESAALLRFWVKHGPRMPYHVRQEAMPLWVGYAAWRRRREQERTEETGRETVETEPIVVVECPYGR